MHSIQSSQYLLCDISGVLDHTPPYWNCVSSPIQCLNKAVEEDLSVLIILFLDISIREREILLDLCTALKQNKYTKDTTVIALLDSQNRNLVERLKLAGIDYIKYSHKNDLTCYMILKLMKELSPHDRLEEQLKALCPFLLYKQIDPRHEISLCQAYLDRLVLGKHRLTNLCQTVEHCRCEYFLNPRIKPL